MPSVFQLEELAEFLGAELKGSTSKKIVGIASLEQASQEQISFFTNSRYLQLLTDTKAGAVLIAPEQAAKAPCSALVMDNPYLGYALLSAKFEVKKEPVCGIHLSAQIAKSAQISPFAQISANVVIGEDTIIDDHVYLGANTVIGDRCHIANDVYVNANVTLYSDVKIGEQSLIHSGAIIGADGFGFAQDGRKWIKISQLAGVTIGRNVEVGAGTTIDCGALSDTVIADGVKLDNQIQVAHNVVIGENTAIAGCTAIAGSTKIGAYCTIAGCVGIVGHLSIADGSHITAMSLVTKSLSKPGAYSSGTGLMPHRQWKKNVVRFRQLDELAKRTKLLEDKINTQKG